MAVEGKGKEYTEWQERATAPEMLPSLSGDGGGGCGVGVPRFVNAITVDLPSLTTELNQHSGGNSSA